MARERVTFEAYQKALADAPKGKRVFVEARTLAKKSVGIPVFGVFVRPTPSRVNMAQIEANGPAYVKAFFEREEIEIAIGLE